jgi:hypothetical protein
LRQTKPDVPFQERTKMSSDPLLQPYKIKNLTLRNRIMTTSHEPAYPVDGMPKDSVSGLPRRTREGRCCVDHDRRFGSRVS